MNIRDLEYLVALDDHRHFGRAAAACLVSQPTLSTQVKKLEAELGAPLVERGQRQVHLTLVGEQIAQRARVVLGEVADIRALAQQASDPRGGSLRLGVFPTLGPYLLPHLTGPLKKAFPNLELLLVEEQSHLLVDRLHAGTLDAALLAMPSGDASLHEEAVFVEEFVAALPVGHPLASAQEPLSTKDFTAEQILLLAEGHCMRDQALAVCQGAGASAPSGFEATSLETLRHMVAAGVGTTLLPRLAVSDPMPAHPGVVLREFAEPKPHRVIGLHWRESSVFSTLLPEVADVIRELPTDAIAAA